MNGNTEMCDIENFLARICPTEITVSPAPLVARISIHCIPAGSIYTVPPANAGRLSGLSRKTCSVPLYRRRCARAYVRNVNRAINKTEKKKEKARFSRKGALYVTKKRRHSL